MTMTKEKAPFPFSIRLSFDERAQLEQAAGNMALGAYIREKLLTTPEERKAVRQAPTEDRKILGQLLAVLGKAHLANNLNQLAKAVNSGSLDVTPDTERMIRECYAEVMWMLFPCRTGGSLSCVCSYQGA
jgi:Bacterial mobilisation protein (MobC)